MPAAAPPQPRRRVGLLLIVALAVYIADVVSKVAVVATLSGRAPVRLFGGVVQLLVLRNSGAAFSIGTSMTVVFTLIAVGVIAFILRTSRRLRSLPWAITLGLLLGGATGNLTDRLARSPGVLRGDVVDWIQLPHWPVFNLADSAIVCGGVLAVLLAARGYRLDGTREISGPDTGPRAGDGSGEDAPAAAVPDPATPDPAGPDAARPDPAKPDPARPGPGRLDAAGADPAKPDPARPGPGRLDAAGADPARPDAARPGPGRPDAASPDPARLDAARPGPARPDAARPGPARSEPAVPELARPDTASRDAGKDRG